MSEVEGVVEGNYKLPAVLTHSAQINKMLKYKNVKFLQLFAKKCALLHTFVEFLQISATFYTLFSRFFLA